MTQTQVRTGLGGLFTAQCLHSSPHPEAVVRVHDCIYHVIPTCRIWDTYAIRYLYGVPAVVQYVPKHCRSLLLLRKGARNGLDLGPLQRLLTRCPSIAPPSKWLLIARLRSSRLSSELRSQAMDLDLADGDDDGDGNEYANFAGTDEVDGCPGCHTLLVTGAAQSYRSPKPPRT